MLCVVGLVALLAVVAAGCGSSGSSSSSESTSKEGAEESTTPSTEGDEGEAADAGKTYAPGVPSLEEYAKAPAEEKLPTSGPKAAKDKTIINVSCGEESSGCKTFAQGMAEPAKVIGWDFKTIDGKNNQNNGWPRAMREAVVQRPDAIVINGVNCPEILQPLQEAKELEIPVISVQALDCDAKSLGTGEEPLFIPFEYTESSTDGEEYNLEQGRYQAGFIIDSNQGKAKVILSPYETPSGELVADGWREQLEKCSECEIAGEVPWNATEIVNGTLGKNMETALLKYPEANAVLAQYDSVAEVLAKPVLDAGRATTTPTSGGEGAATAQALIREEKGYSGTGSGIDIVQLDWAVIDTLNRYFQGEPAVPEAVGFGLVDKDHLSPPGQEYESPLDYKAAYEKLWGVK
jgi:ribose transport system substrate-binding protein